jgi:hypothetical protein
VAVAQSRDVYSYLTGGICLEGATDSDREVVVTENMLCGTLGGLRETQEGVENCGRHETAHSQACGRNWGERHPRP